MRRLTAIFLGGIVLGIGLAAIPIQAVIDEWSIQQAGSVVGGIQLTYLVAIGIAAVGAVLARPGLVKALGLGGLGFIVAVGVIMAIGYLLIGSLLGGG